MKHEELTLTELKEWTKRARNLVEYLQDDYHDYLPTGKKEAFASITNSIYNCLDCLWICLTMMNWNWLTVLLTQWKTWQTITKLTKMAQYHELMKEVEGEEQGARGLAYDDTIHEYIDKRTEQLKEQANVEELINKVALYESELLVLCRTFVK